MIALTTEETKFCAGLRRLRRVVGLCVLARGDEADVGQLVGLRVGDDLLRLHRRGVLDRLDVLRGVPYRRMAVIFPGQTRRRCLFRYRRDVVARLAERRVTGGIALEHHGIVR